MCTKNIRLTCPLAADMDCSSSPAGHAHTLRGDNNTYCTLQIQTLSHRVKILFFLQASSSSKSVIHFRARTITITPDRIMLIAYIYIVITFYYISQDFIELPLFCSLYIKKMNKLKMTYVSMVKYVFMSLGSKMGKNLSYGSQAEK